VGLAFRLAPLHAGSQLLFRRLCGMLRFVPAGPWAAQRKPSAGSSL